MMVQNQINPWEITEKDIYKVRLNTTDAEKVGEVMNRELNNIPENTPAVKVYMGNECINSFMPLWTMNGSWDKASQKMYHNWCEKGTETTKNDIIEDVIISVLMPC